MLVTHCVELEHWPKESSIVKAELENFLDSFFVLKNNTVQISKFEVSENKFLMNNYKKVFAQDMFVQ